MVLGYLVLTAGRDFEEGHSELRVSDSRFLHLRNTELFIYIYIYIYIYILLHTLATSLSDQSHIQNKQLGLTMLFQGPSDNKQSGRSMLTSYVLDYDMTVQILLLYLQPVHLGD